MLTDVITNFVCWKCDLPNTYLVILRGYTFMLLSDRNSMISSSISIKNSKILFIYYRNKELYIRVEMIM